MIYSTCMVCVLLVQVLGIKDSPVLSLADLVREDQTVTLIDCDGSKYTVPLANTDASVVNNWQDYSIVAGDSNGMGSLIIDMANTKNHRLRAALAASSGLKSTCEPDTNGVNSQGILARFGEPIPVTGNGVMDDESFSVVKNLLLRRGNQKKYTRPPAARLFHSDQANVKIEDILPNKKESLNLYQGDMVYAKQFVELGSTYNGQDTMNWAAWNLWPNARVNWYVDTAAPVDACAVATYKTAASMMEKYTCLRFQDNVVPSSGVKSIKLTSDGTSCWAYVGMSSQSQVNLGGPGCQIPGIALHEVGHAVGLIHQQSRMNRDTYVTVEWDNIKDAAVDNFKKISSGSTYDTVVASKPYDYSSIMHYSVCEFSTTRYSDPCGKTLDPTDKSAAGTMGQREYLSQTDIDTINQMYGCTTTCGDGIQNQGEEGVDCGGPCARVCNDPKSDGILPLPDQCMASQTTPLTQTEIYIIAAVGGLVVLILAFALVAYFRNRRVKKDAAKQQLLNKSGMTQKQLQVALRRKAAAASSTRTGTTSVVNRSIPAPSAPPHP
jgi:hypothetical protein